MSGKVVSHKNNSDWAMMYKLLLKFIEVMQHSDVPDRCFLEEHLTKRQISNMYFIGLDKLRLKKLSCWVSKQRVKRQRTILAKKKKYYSKDNNIFLTDEQEEQLNRINFKWTVQFKKLKKLKKLKKY